MSSDSENGYTDDDFQDDVEIDSGDESDEFIPAPKVKTKQHSNKYRNNRIQMYFVFFDRNVRR